MRDWTTSTTDIAVRADLSSRPQCLAAASPARSREAVDSARRNPLIRSPVLICTGRSVEVSEWAGAGSACYSGERSESFDRKAISNSPS
jgi:hypothetical protein